MLGVTIAVTTDEILITEGVDDSVVTVARDSVGMEPAE
jgi:hypothetical protein